MFEARDACRESGKVIDDRTGMSDRTAACRRDLSSLSPAQAEQPGGQPPAGFGTRIAEGVRRDAEDRSFSGRVVPTAACHGLRGLSSWRGRRGLS